MRYNLYQHYNHKLGSKTSLRFFFFRLIYLKLLHGVHAFHTLGKIQKSMLDLSVFLRKYQLTWLYTSTRGRRSLFQANRTALKSLLALPSCFFRSTGSMLVRSDAGAVNEQILSAVLLTLSVKAFRAVKNHFLEVLF